jgi:hypothetical protein
MAYCDPPYFEKANRLYLNHYNRGITLGLHR